MYISRHFLLLIFTLSAFIKIQAQPIDTTVHKPAPKREFRGVWVATVGNIDWPNKPGLTSDQQKEELANILNAHQQSGINAVMLQVRPAADAFYAKSREPWSKWLTGKQGQAPNVL